MIFIFHYINPLKLKFGYFLWEHFDSIDILCLWGGIIALILLLLAKLFLKANKMELIILFFSLILIFYFNVYQSYNFVYEFYYYKNVGQRVHSCVKVFKMKYGNYPKNIEDLDMNCLKENNLDLNKLKCKVYLKVISKKVLNKGFRVDKYLDDEYDILIFDSMFGVTYLKLNEDKTDFIISDNS